MNCDAGKVLNVSEKPQEHNGKKSSLRFELYVPASVSFNAHY